MWLNKHIKTQSFSGAELERSGENCQNMWLVTLLSKEKPWQTMEQGQREGDEESCRSRFIRQKKKRNWIRMFPNYIINSIIIISFSLTCQASTCTILSWPLGQIRIPCTSNHAKDTTNKNSIYGYTRCSED